MVPTLLPTPAMRNPVDDVASSIGGFITGEYGSWEGCLHEGDHVQGCLASLDRFDAVGMGRRTYEVGLRNGKTGPYPIEFEVPLQHSSWMALRILPSSHTNPIFVTIGGEPVRASARSAVWCRDAVDRCWEQKRSQISEAEREAAQAGYERARAIYARILEEALAREAK